MPREAMQDKEKQMISIGAKLVEESNVEKTATEVNIEKSAEMSTLSSVTKNVTEGFQKALEWCTIFTGDSVGSVSFKLNDDFKIASMTPEDRRQQFNY